MRNREEQAQEVAAQKAQAASRRQGRLEMIAVLGNKGSARQLERHGIQGATFAKKLVNRGWYMSDWDTNGYGAIQARIFRPEPELESNTIEVSMHSLHVDNSKNELGKRIVPIGKTVAWRVVGIYTGVGDEQVLIDLEGGSSNWAIAAMDMFRQIDMAMSARDESVAAAIDAMETFNKDLGKVS